jgi:hypothetical protein
MEHSWKYSEKENQKYLEKDLSHCQFVRHKSDIGRSQWPRGLRCGSTAARLLRSWVRISPGAWMSVCCECCVLSGRSLCDELITSPEESYRMWCVVVCSLEKQTSWMRRPRPNRGLWRQEKKNLTWTDMMSKPGLRGNRAATDLLNHGADSIKVKIVSNYTTDSVRTAQ